MNKNNRLIFNLFFRGSVSSLKFLNFEGVNSLERLRTSSIPPLPLLKTPRPFPLINFH